MVSVFALVLISRGNLRSLSVGKIGEENVTKQKRVCDAGSGITRRQ